MALQNKYVSPLINTVGMQTSQLNQFRGGAGGQLKSVYETFTIAAADDVASVYRVFKGLDPNIIPVRICIGNTAMAGTTGFDLGLYATNYGAIYGTGNQFIAAGTLATARASLYPGVALDGMTAVNINVYYKRLFEIVGQTTDAPTIATTRRDAFDLVLKVTTSGGVLGTVSILMDFVTS